MKQLACSRAFEVVAGWALLACLSGCAECDREGCDSLKERAAAQGTGIGGVVGHQSDAVTDGCAECPLGEARLELWAVDESVGTEAAARSLIAARAPDVLATALGRYVQPLVAGSYLLCVRPGCVDVTVAEGQTLTVNLQRRDGPTGFYVARAIGVPLAEDYGFDVGY
jgi:hypothetical protein